MVFLLILLVLCLLPDQAWAWGPGVHLAIANTLLARTADLPQALVAILSAHPEHFLYGALSADIFIGKGCTTTPTHSHNWDTARALWRTAHEPAHQAYAYGYLTHLAADVIAHNYLVPNLLGFSSGRGKLAHTYVEMLADLRVEWPQKQGSFLFRRPHSRSDALLLQAVHQRTLPFTLKKHLFRRSLGLVEHQRYKGSLRLMQRILPFARQDQLIDQAIGFAHDLALDILRNPVHSPAIACDPVGSVSLARVRGFQRKQRRYYATHGHGIIFPLDTRLTPSLNINRESCT
ncbi:zinc dependent phospholipase C family protein [Desulfovibrionales bacterium]